ncbi:hypothetical protein U1Q18_011416, partial [Sarracenia purpurea var. burkii]
MEVNNLKNRQEVKEEVASKTHPESFALPKENLFSNQMAKVIESSKTHTLINKQLRE